MSMQRRTFLRLSAVGAAGVGVSLLGAGQAGAAPTRFLRATPTTPFAVGVRQYDWRRGSRKLTTFVYYPTTGTPGRAPVTNAPVATGVFPICEFMHGFSSSPQKSLAVIRPLAEAGFIVPAPHFAGLSIGDVNNGNQSKDISEIITQTLALNEGSDPLAGHIDKDAGVGVSGHSMGGMTTLGLLTHSPDPRIKAAIPMSCVDAGNPSSTVKANVLFMHGDRDRLTTIASARKAYDKLAGPKAFLTFRGGDHASYFGDSRTIKTFLDWMRWSLYGDNAARDRLPADAKSSTTTWESALG